MIHCINLPNRTNRKELFIEEMNRQGITSENYRFWDGVRDSPVFKGVSKAHKQIVSFAKEQKLPEITISEDDVKFPSPEGYKYFIQNKPDNFDLYLSGIYMGEIKDGKVDYFAGLHFYIISERFYDTFLSADENKHIDIALKGLGDYHVCYPFAAIQHELYSDCEQAPSNHSKLLKDRLIYQ